MLNKNLIIFSISFLLTFISLIYLFFIYLNWDKEIDKSNISVEVNLPIIDWDKYMQLSKKTNNVE